MHQSTPTTNSTDVDRSQPLFTGMAQGQRAGLITPRSLDRNGLPVYIITSQWCIKALEHNSLSHILLFEAIFYRYSSAAERLKHRLLPLSTIRSELRMVIAL